MNLADIKKVVITYLEENGIVNVEAIAFENEIEIEYVLLACDELCNEGKLTFDPFK